ncbi:MAG: hypothetical protein K6G27_01065 [Lachnospiraceae bacterium]|nr:hypothetical protein [Lachnospiraceae bacterium]
MTPMEITLLIVGVIIFCLSFLIKDKEQDEQIYDEETLKNQVRRITERELDSMNLKVKEAADSSIEYAMEKAERGLEKISNEKIMAVSEYSNTIMDEINKSHKEVMFLYDMLTDKQTDLKNTVRKAEAAAKEVEDAGKSAAEQAVQQTARQQEGSMDSFSDEFEAFDNSRIDRVEAATVADLEPDNNNRKIIELHKSGRTAVEIAKELNLGVGEVNLVLDLFER